MSSSRDHSMTRSFFPLLLLFLLVLTSVAEFDPGDTLFDARSEREGEQQHHS